MGVPVHKRRGEGMVDHLLVLSVACVAVLVLAWVYMPDTRRSFATAVSSLMQYLGLEGM